jgi:hypothetical protein
VTVFVFTPPASLAAAGARRALAVLVPCLVAALGAMPALADAQKNKNAPVVTVPYTTQAGDTLYEIAARYLRDQRDWAVLSRLNKIPAPRHLQAGVQVQLPVALLREEQESARVLATSGPVERAFGAGPFTPLAAGMTLGEGDRLRTGHEGFATLELADGSHVTVSQDAMVEIGKLRQTALTGASDRVFDLQHGEVDSEVTHATRKDDRFQIRSPSVVAGVRGTRFRVNYDTDQQQTAVEAPAGDGRAAASLRATRVRALRQCLGSERFDRHADRVAGRSLVDRSGQDPGRQDGRLRPRAG